VLSTLGCDATGRVKTISARFTAPVFPGDALDVDVWHQDNAVRFKVRVDDRTVLDDGLLELHE
jgi:acyl dehydratase